MQPNYCFPKLAKQQDSKRAAGRVHFMQRSCDERIQRGLGKGWALVWGQSGKEVRDRAHIYLASLCETESLISIHLHMKVCPSVATDRSPQTNHLMNMYPC